MRHTLLYRLHIIWCNSYFINTHEQSWSLALWCSLIKAIWRMMLRHGNARSSLCIDQQFRFFAAIRRDIVSYRVMCSTIIRSKGSRFNTSSENKFILRLQTLSFHRHPVIRIKIYALRCVRDPHVRIFTLIRRINMPILPTCRWIYSIRRKSIRSVTIVTTFSLIFFKYAFPGSFWY